MLPKIADYRQVWDVVTTLTWEWAVVLIAATALNIVTFAPPWMIALPGLGFRQALVLTQASTALSIIAPAGAAVGIAGAWARCALGVSGPCDVTRAVTLTGVWSQLTNLVYPVVALFLLKVDGGGDGSCPGTAVFVGVAVLGSRDRVSRARPLFGRPRPRRRRRGRAPSFVGAPARCGGSR